MSYTKLWKVCRDAALGFQSINNAIANMETFRTAWTAEHGSQEVTPRQVRGGTTDPFNGIGRHNTTQVPRAILSVTVVAWGPGSFPAFTYGSQSTVKSVARLAAGTWQITMDGTLATFWAAAWPVQVDTDIRFCKPVSYFPSSSNGTPPSIVVGTYDAGGGAFALTDYSFSCAIYGY